MMTKGPWKLGLCAGQVEGPNGELLAGGINFAMAEEIKLANARAIAQVPAMVDFILKMSRCVSWTDPQTALNRYIDEARAILRAMEGEK